MKTAGRIGQAEVASSFLAEAGENSARPVNEFEVRVEVDSRRRERVISGKRMA